MPNIDSIKNNSGQDPVLAKALEKYPSLMSRLEGAENYDDVVYAIEKGAIDDGNGDFYVFDLEGYEEGYEDEVIKPNSVPLEKLKNAVEYIRDNSKKIDYNGVREMIEHIPVRNSVIRIWSLEPRPGSNGSVED